MTLLVYSYNRPNQAIKNKNVQKNIKKSAFDSVKYERNALKILFKKAITEERRMILLRLIFGVALALLLGVTSAFVER